MVGANVDEGSAVIGYLAVLGVGYVLGTKAGRRRYEQIVGTYRAISSKHVPRYLAEFEYRFNRRYDLAAMIPRLTWASVRTQPMPYRLLKLAEVHA